MPSRLAQEAPSTQQQCIASSCLDIVQTSCREWQVTAVLGNQLAYLQQRVASHTQAGENMQGRCAQSAIRFLHTRLEQA